MSGKVLAFIVVLTMLLTAGKASAQLLEGKRNFTHEDSLRGTITPDRAWWDVLHYDLSVTPDMEKRMISGTNIIRFKVLSPGKVMRVDLQEPMAANFVALDGTRVMYKRDGNNILVDLGRELAVDEDHSLSIQFSGEPRVAKNPPWDGGWIWSSDKQGRPWVSVACQGLGASVWYPCKDHQSDEPDGAMLSITVPGDMVAIGNGRLGRISPGEGGKRTWRWIVNSPINAYNLVPYIGHYSELQDSVVTPYGKLDLSYWVLEADTARAREQFKQVPLVLTCFEEWFGPYPFRNDGFKLVQAPHLGMEHQSAIAYGNGFRNGYQGTDLSGTGHGLQWDYIIVHETAHEWFGNSITTADIADMWVHEGFADYAETIYTQCQQGVAAGNDYVTGLRSQIQNDRPVIGPYGVNQEGSGDMYYKGANLIHTIRQMIGNDDLFRSNLLQMCAEFSLRVVTSAQIEKFWSDRSGIDLSKVFDQYLRTTMIPQLEWKIKKKHVVYRWTNCVDGFNMPVLIYIDGSPAVWQVTTEWATSPNEVAKKATLTADRNWYITVKGPR